MHQLTAWIKESEKQEVPCAIRAAIAHYQFATIHPYFDGNGRTARLLTNLVLHLGGYDLKGLYSLEEYYAKNLGGYYEAISIGPSHNYYAGRAEADITVWIDYFCLGMAMSFEAVAKRAEAAATSGVSDKHAQLRALDAMQRKCLELFPDCGREPMHSQKGIGICWIDGVVDFWQAYRGISRALVANGGYKFLLQIENGLVKLRLYRNFDWFECAPTDSMRILHQRHRS